MNIKNVRHALSEQAGVPVSQADFGRILGLNSQNARNTVHRWEEGGATGPAIVAATYLMQGCLDDEMQQIVPEYVFGGGLGNGGSGHEVLVRLHWPRFLGLVVGTEIPIHADSEWAWVAENVERLVVLMWIDQPDGLPGTPAAEHWVQRAAAAVQEYTLDSVDETF